MATKPIVGCMSDWSGVLKDLFRQIDDGSLTLYQMQAVVEHRDPFGSSPDINWRKVYETLGMEAEYADFAEAHSAAVNPSFWTVPVLKGVTCDEVVAALRKSGVAVSLYCEDLGKGVIHNDRSPDSGSYMVAFCRNVEADEENKNESANDLASTGHKGITLLERLLLELGYFLITGRHLDEQNTTLCTGSRYSEGGVPSVCWSLDDRRVCVNWYNSGNAFSDLRSRSAVSS